jgi:hypothetical protein
MNQYMTSDTELSGTDEAFARAQALDYARNVGKPVALWMLIDVARPSDPVWDSAAQQPPAAEPEQRFKKDQIIWARTSQDVSSGKNAFREAVVLWVDNTDPEQPCFVRFLDNDYETWPKIGNIQGRPEPAPEPARALHAGETVRVEGALNDEALRDGEIEVISGDYAYVRLGDGPYIGVIVRRKLDCITRKTL